MGCSPGTGVLTHCQIAKTRFLIVFGVALVGFECKKKWFLRIFSMVYYFAPVVGIILMIFLGFWKANPL